MLASVNLCAETSAPAAVISPTPGSTLTDSMAVFTWSAVHGVTNYYLWIGTAVGSHDLVNATIPTGTSYTAVGLPTDGRVLYVRLYSLVNGTFRYSSCSYTAATQVNAAILSPAPESTLTGRTAVFKWSGGSAVSSYSLWIGSTSGSSDLLNVTTAATSNSYAVTDLPSDGRTLYVRLYSLVNGNYQYNSYTYKAVSGIKAAIVSPAGGTTLPGPTATFTWAGGAGVTNYYLWVGTTAGGRDLINATIPASTLSYTARNLPVNGEPLYVRLYSLIDGIYQYNSYVYVAAAGVQAELVSPAPGNTLPGATAVFSWIGGVNVSRYYLWIGATVGSNNVLNLTLAPTTTSYLVNNLPTDASVLYVRLYSLINGVYQYKSYTYTAASQPQPAVRAAGALQLNTDPLITPTYEGSGQAMHPGILFFPFGWHGFEYWMVVTPYPQTNASIENPSILASNDGINWVVPPGLVNPVAPRVGQHLADGDLLYDAASDQLWLYYVGMDANGTTLYRRTSSDGVQWSDALAVLVVPGYELLSPALEQRGSQYLMWSVNSGTQSPATATSVEYRESIDGINWSAPQKVNIVQAGYVMWHLDVIWVADKGEFWMLLAAYNQGWPHTDLFFCRSTDGMNWQTYAKPVLARGPTWDSDAIYGSTLLYDRSNDSLRLWYTGMRAEEWHVGYGEANYTRLAAWLQN